MNETMLKARTRVTGAMLASGWLAICTVSAQAATIRTTDGKNWSGEVSFVDGAFRIGGTNVSPPQVLRLDFLPPASTGAGSEKNSIVALLPTSESQPQPWRYTTSQPPESWIKPEFNQSPWTRTMGGFGSGTAKGMVRTDWKTSDIWMRRRFTIGAVPEDPQVRIFHNDDAEVFLNGHEAGRFQGRSGEYVERPLEAGARDSVRVGENVIAVHCRNREGGQFIDVGLYDGGTTVIPLPLRNRSEPKTIPDHALRGEYFNDRELQGPAQVRYDPQLDFDWGSRSPMPTIRNHDFSARWTGVLKVPASASYVFELFVNDSARFWLGEALIFDHWQSGPLKLTSKPVELKAGAHYGIYLEYRNLAGTSGIKLSWSTPTMPVTVIPSNLFVPAGSPKAFVELAQPEIAGKTQTSANSQKPTEVLPAGVSTGVLLAGGSFIPRQVQFADDTLVRFSEDRHTPTVPLSSVAMIIFQSPSGKGWAMVPPEATGVLLRDNRGFLEGEFKGISSGKVRISSVLFGLKTFSISGVAAVVLGNLRQEPRKFEILTRDQWRILADNFRVEPNGLVMEDLAMSGIRIPFSSVSEIKRQRP